MSETSASKLAARYEAGDLPPADADTTAEEVVEEVDETEEPTTETEESEETTEDEELPESVKEILKKNRKELREAKAEIIALKKAQEAKAEEAPADDKFKTLYINTAAKQALTDAGLTTGTDRFLKMLDLSSIEVDESGTITGLEDQIEDLKEDFKDIFAPEKPVKKTVRADASGRRAPVETPKTSAERLAERFS